MGVATTKRSRVAIDTRPLRIPAYRRLWGSTAIVAVGSQFTVVAVPKQIYDLTGSSGFVGLAGAFGLVPLLIFGLWGGAIADAFDRRTVILVTNVGVAATSVAFWVQAVVGANVWIVLSLLAVQQAFVAINMPTRTASVARLVPPDLIASATALTATVGSFGMVFGPLLAGALMPFTGLPILYLVDAIVLVLATVIVSGLPKMAPLDGVRRRAGLKDIADGFRYVAAKNVLLASFLLDIIAMVAGMPRALFPEMAERTFGDPHGGGIALGLLYASIPIGALLFGLFSGWLSNISRHGVGVTASVIVWGLAIIGFGLAGHLWLAVTFMVIAGAADMVSMVYRSAILQTAVTDEMRGRMQGVFTVVVAGGPRIADLLHGWGAAGVGTAAAATGGGVLVIVLTVLAVVCLPAFWRYRATTG
ncbi:MFS transporter [Actinophytocola algeriensis]|uniref:MFS family permease n=1 Tax=Actinophytocola algeriensis TaxID=1768010 RepID=A0A7W7QGD0_9PSEU|nr:MFS transporter [Actinophytocola algeriensis]MBB4912566.1 MFS family permease [Actinophytocola algeriensis]MBE1478940.1 MFS family permease [Actinophytocola algeriensis]